MLGGLLKTIVAPKKYGLNRKIFVLWGALKIIGSATLSVLHEQACTFGDVCTFIRGAMFNLRVP